MKLPRNWRAALERDSRDEAPIASPHWQPPASMSDAERGRLLRQLAEHQRRWVSFTEIVPDAYGLAPALAAVQSAISSLRARIARDDTEDRRDDSGDQQARRFRRQQSRRMRRDEEE